MIILKEKTVSLYRNDYLTVEDSMSFIIIYLSLELR